MTTTPISRSLKTAFAVAAFAGISATAIAQGTPPNPSVPNPATGAGQTDTRGNPKGETGTPGGAGAGARPAAAPAMAPAMAPAPAMAAPSPAPAPAPMMSDTTTRPARADRN